MRGPLVYCLESADHDSDMRNIVLDTEADLHIKSEPDLLGGISVIRERDGPLTAIPYYCRDNREPGSMAVWIKERSDS